MSRQEMEKLLGGYATGTLSAEEREALFAAALEDQQLFDALAREQPLRDLLADPAARAEALAALDPERPRFAWLRRPAFAAVACAVAACAVALVIVTRPKPAVQMAILKVTALPAPPPPAQVQIQPAAPPRVLRMPASRPKKAGSGTAGELQPPPALVAQDAAAPAPPAAAPATAPAPPPPRAPTARELYMASAGATNLALARSSFAAPPENSGVVGGVIGRPPGNPPPPPPAAESRRYGLRRVAPRRVEPAAEKASAALPSTANLGIRWRILRKQPDGAWAADASGGSFPKGEPLRLAVEPNDAGYLYVQERDGDRWTPLYHDRVERRGSTRCRPAESCHTTAPGRTSW